MFTPPNSPKVPPNPITNDNDNRKKPPPPLPGTEEGDSKPAAKPRRSLFHREPQLQPQPQPQPESETMSNRAFARLVQMCMRECAEATSREARGLTRSEIKAGLKDFIARKKPRATLRARKSGSMPTNPAQQGDKFVRVRLLTCSKKMEDTQHMMTPLTHRKDYRLTDPTQDLTANTPIERENERARLEEQLHRDMRLKADQENYPLVFSGMFFYSEQQPNPSGNSGRGRYRRYPILNILAPPCQADEDAMKRSDFWERAQYFTNHKEFMAANFAPEATSQLPGLDVEEQVRVRQEEIARLQRQIETILGQEQVDESDDDDLSY